MIPLLIAVLATSLALTFGVAALIPFETLGWWAGWFDHDHSLRAAATALRSLPPTTPDGARNFVVFFTGVAGVTGDTVLPQDRVFLERLRAHAPESIIVDDVFPYSVTNTGLTGHRPMARFWRSLNAGVQRNPTSLLRWPINVRNILELAVSADTRYGPVYNLGVAAEIVLGLGRHGYRLGSGVPLTLIGSSGGAQIALGACTYLKELLGAPLQLVAIGGAMADDIGITYVDHVTLLYGSRDPVPSLVAALFVGRWPFVVWSTWNRAVAGGKFSKRCIGPIHHDAAGGYFDPHRCLPNGQSYVDHTARECVVVMDAFLASVAIPATMER